jgi:hypothetical protein
MGACSQPTVRPGVMREGAGLFLRASQQGVVRGAALPYRDAATARECFHGDVTC